MSPWSPSGPCTSTISAAATTRSASRAAGQTWYFAEGFTGGNAQIAFETFLLIGNDNDTPATVTATYFLDIGAPITRSYTVLPKSRFNIWVDSERTAQAPAHSVDGVLRAPR